jgi:hypothetical protein
MFNLVKKVSISTSTESQPRAEISTQTDTIPLKPLAKPISLPYYEELEEQAQEIPQRKRKYEKKKQGPRKNSIADLEQRYTAVSGYIYVGPNLKVKDFQELVENLEKKNNLS